MTKFTTTAQDSNASEPLPDGGCDVSAVFSRFCELAIADGDVPDDGSGLDGVWTRTIEARKRDRDWNVAVNAETERDLEVDDFPREGDSTSVSAGSAVVFLGAWPAGVVDPVGGQVVVEQLDADPRSIEDELLRDVETELLDAGADIERTIPDQEAIPDGGSRLRCASCRATVTLDDTLELQAPEISDGTIARVRVCEDCRPDAGNKRPVTAYKDLHKAVIKRANGIEEEQATLADSEIMPDGGETVADAAEADARSSERLPSVGECRFPSGRDYCDGQHILNPDSLLEDGFIRFPCTREGCDAETVMPRGIGIERLDNAGFDVAALARRADTQLGSVWLDCPDCGARGSILAEGDPECQDCEQTFEPEEVW
jgi:hypothetical protein